MTWCEGQVPYRGLRHDEAPKTEPWLSDPCLAWRLPVGPRYGKGPQCALTRILGASLASRSFGFQASRPH